MSRQHHFQIDERYTLISDSPALRDELGDGLRDYGPADTLPSGDTAAMLVVSWATRPHRTHEEREAARLFLSQWPDGPQLPQVTGTMQEDH